MNEKTDAANPCLLNMFVPFEVLFRETTLLKSLEEVFVKIEVWCGGEHVKGFVSPKIAVVTAGGEKRIPWRGERAEGLIPLNDGLASFGFLVPNIAGALTLDVELFDEERTLLTNVEVRVNKIRQSYVEFKIVTGDIVAPDNAPNKPQVPTFFPAIVIPENTRDEPRSVRRFAWKKAFQFALLPIVSFFLLFSIYKLSADIGDENVSASGVSAAEFAMWSLPDSIGEMEQEQSLSNFMEEYGLELGAAEGQARRLMNENENLRHTILTLVSAPCIQYPIVEAPAPTCPPPVVLASRPVKPKGAPLTLDDLRGIPRFEAQSTAEKLAFLRFHNQRFNQKP